MKHHRAKHPFAAVEIARWWHERGMELWAIADLIETMTKIPTKVRTVSDWVQFMTRCYG